jgi:nucleotide-binding universal stress UspA family protein
MAGQLAIRLAGFHRARITFVYVVDASVLYELANDSGMTAHQVREELEATGRRYLNHLQRLAAQAEQKADQVIRYGEPHSEIESLARQLRVDLIVMGRVGQRGPRRILIGSVTERVLEYAPCPVLIVGNRA